MTAHDLMNIFLRLEMAGKEGESDLAFDAGRDGVTPFSITGVHLDEDGDICLESDVRQMEQMSPREIYDAVSAYDGNRTVYFVSIDPEGQAELYNIKDGGFRDRHDTELRLVHAGALCEALESLDQDVVLHFESGTITFTVNSVYLDEEGCLCLESNEIMELGDWPVAMVAEELRAVDPDTRVYFYDDEAHEYYGIYYDECRVDEAGELWIKVR